MVLAEIEYPKWGWNNAQILKYTSDEEFNNRDVLMIP